MNSPQTIPLVEAITRYLGEGICATDQNGLIRFLNPAAEQLLDIPTSNLLGHSIVERFPLQVVDSQNPITLGEIVCQTLTRQSVRRGSNGFLTPRDGWPIPVGYAINPLLHAGNLLGMVIVFFDLRPIRRAEQIEREARSNLFLVNKLRREIDQLTELATATSGPTAEKSIDRADFRSQDATEQARLTHAYAQLIDQALDQQSFRVNYRVSESLRKFAELLGTRQAGPRDLIEMHSAAIQAKKSSLSVRGLKAFVEESRFVLIELLGNLVLYYREKADRSSAVDAATAHSRDQTPQTVPSFSSLGQSIAVNANRGREMFDSKFLLKLYVTGQSPRSNRAIANLRRICESSLDTEYEIEIIDVIESPHLAEIERILATPTLIKELPVPIRRIIGDLSDVDKVLLGLDCKPIADSSEPPVLPAR